MRSRRTDGLKDTSLFDEGNGRLQVLSHAKVQHNAGQPPPAGTNSNTDDKTQPLRSISLGWRHFYLQNDDAVTFSVRDRFCRVGIRPMLYLMEQRLQSMR